MRIQKHRGATLAQLRHDVADEQTPERIEAGRRLVEKHELRVVNQRLGQANPLQHALAVAANAAIGGVDEIDAREQRIDARLEIQPAQTMEPAVKAQRLAAGQRVMKAE